MYYLIFLRWLKDIKYDWISEYFINNDIYWQTNSVKWSNLIVSVVISEIQNHCHKNISKGTLSLLYTLLVMVKKILRGLKKLKTGQGLLEFNQFDIMARNGFDLFWLILYLIWLFKGDATLLRLRLIIKNVGLLVSLISDIRFWIK